MPKDNPSLDAPLKKFAIDYVDSLEAEDYENAAGCLIIIQEQILQWLKSLPQMAEEPETNRKSKLRKSL